VSENPKIFINPRSGSIRITGEVDFVDADGNLVKSETNVKLCGCGHSQEKPYCDGSHKQFLPPKDPRDSKDSAEA